MDRVVGIGDFFVSNDKEDKIKTFALSSCVAVTVYYPEMNVAGMIHVMLPEPSENAEIKAPSFYAKTGIPLLINNICYKYGCDKNKLQIKMFGGANSSRDRDIFKIGYRNIEAAKEALESMNLKYRLEEVGGTISRTLEMDVASGDVKITRLPISYI